MTFALRTHVDVVVAALEADNVDVHRGKGPDDPLASVPYVVIRGGGVESTGPAVGMHEDVTPEVHAICVGASSEQAEWMADKVWAALIGTVPVPPTGRAWLVPGEPVQHVLTRPVERDDDFGHGAPLFYAIHIFALPSTPA